MTDDPLDAMKARWNHIQGYLFPWLHEEVDPMTEALGRLVTTLDVIGLEARDALPHWPSGAPSRLECRLRVGVLRHALTTCRYSDKAAPRPERNARIVDCLTAPIAAWTLAYHPAARPGGSRRDRRKRRCRRGGRPQIRSSSTRRTVFDTRSATHGTRRSGRDRE